MLECFVFAVQVGKEVFRAFGQVEYGFEIYNLGACSRCIGEVACKQLQVSQFLVAVFLFVVLVIHIHHKKIAQA
jgi:hypothetical protein